MARSQVTSLSSSLASGRSSPATCDTSRNDGRRNGIPFGVISAGKSRLARCKRSHKARPVFAVGINQPMGDMIFVQKIVELAAIARAILGDDAQPAKFAVALQPLPAHDERAHDRLAHPRQFRQRLAEPVPTGTSRISLSPALPRALASAAVPISIATSPMKSRGPRRGQDLLLPVARLEDFQFAAQDHRQAEIALARFEYQFAAPQMRRVPSGSSIAELPVIELRKGDALGIPVELLVFVEFGHRSR